MAEEASTTYTIEDCKKHVTESSCWLLINGRVYNVTDFLEEHPGGYDIILQSAGRDSTQDFEEIGHSNSAKEILEKYYIGLMEGGVTDEPKSGTSASEAVSASPKSALTRLLLALLPLLILAAAIGLSYVGRQTSA